MAIDFTAAKNTATRLPAVTFDHNAIRCGIRGYSKFAQAVGHYLDTVAFLHPQLLRSTQYRFALRAGRGDEQHRKLIDRQRHQLLGYLDALQLRRLDPDIRYRL